jgi:hypothetical protein
MPWTWPPAASAPGAATCPGGEASPAKLCGTCEWRLAPFNARGQWRDRNITRPFPPPGMLRGPQRYERASGAAGGLARRVREISDHLGHTT